TPNSTPTNLETRTTSKEQEIQKIESYIHDLEEISKKLVNLNSVTQKIVMYSKILLENNISQDNIDFLQRYLPYIKKILQEHLKYRQESSNNLMFFWNLVKSKPIILRFSNTLGDKCANIDSSKSDEFSAELAALDSLLKMKGY
ncbi:MAG: hypothetical protein IJU40_02120, partial [Desulfovibrionaceae bacterium]|nr:hypothetical protein [Desulfovibrionaceae bacterium]